MVGYDSRKEPSMTQSKSLKKSKDKRKNKGTVAIKPSSQSQKNPATPKDPKKY